MTTAAEALVYILAHDAGVSALVSARIYPNVVPEGTAAPAIAYQMISDVPVISQSGFGNMQTTRWQVTIEAGTYTQARSVARAVKTLLNGYRATVGTLHVGPCIVENDQDDYSQITQQPVARLDVLMMHDEH